MEAAEGRERRDWSEDGTVSTILPRSPVGDGDSNVEDSVCNVAFIGLGKNGSTIFGAGEVDAMHDGGFRSGKGKGFASEQIELVVQLFAQGCWVCFTTRSSNV